MNILDWVKVQAEDQVIRDLIQKNYTEVKTWTVWK